MMFKPTPLYQYYQRYEGLKVTPVHQSNPQPFTMAELSTCIDEPINSLYEEFEFSYASMRGDIKLREAITSLYQHDNPTEIACFVGAQEAIFCAMYSVLRAQDKVTAITPIFGPLIATAEEIGCDIDLVSLQIIDEQWRLDLDELEASIKKGARLLVINFPHNPTGATLSEAELLKIIEICNENNCWILSDEVFRGLEHEPEKRLPAVADLYPRAISLGVLSKSFALPALRVGWVSCQDERMVERMVQIKSALSICGSHLDEKISTHVITKHEKVWDRNRRLILENLNQFDTGTLNTDLISTFIKPQAGCTAFPLLHQTISPDDFSEEMIYEKKIMTLPAELFLTDYNGVRFGFGYNSSVKLLSHVFTSK